MLEAGGDGAPPEEGGPTPTCNLKRASLSIWEGQEGSLRQPAAFFSLGRENLGLFPQCGLSGGFGPPR
jgi:hypothetical protein